LPILSLILLNPESFRDNVAKAMFMFFASLGTKYANPILKALFYPHS